MGIFIAKSSLTLISRTLLVLDILLAIDLESSSGFSFNILARLLSSESSGSSIVFSILLLRSVSKGYCYCFGGYMEDTSKVSLSWLSFFERNSSLIASSLYLLNFFLVDSDVAVSINFYPSLLYFPKEFLGVSMPTDSLFEPLSDCYFGFDSFIFYSNSFFNSYISLSFLLTYNYC
jgi:hypothetical protein